LKESVSPKNPERSARKLFAALDRHDLDKATATVAPNFRMTDPDNPEPLRGRVAYRKLWESLFKAFPDLKVRILNVVTEGDELAAEIMATGTFKGPLGNPPNAVPPTGRRVELRWAAFGRVNSKGLITEGRVYSPGIIKQLGLET